MVVKETRGGREYDKFVADGSGDTSIRVKTTTSITTAASSTSSTVNNNSGAASVNLTETDVEGKSRIGIQIFNTGSGSSRNATFL